jgi:chromosome partitioning protein
MAILSSSRLLVLGTLPSPFFVISFITLYDVNIDQEPKYVDLMLAVVYLSVKRVLEVTQTIIAVVNQKGGVGKTTTAVNLAAQLATSKRRVMLLDLDPQGNATSSLGVDKNSLKATLYDSLLGQLDVTTIAQPTSTKNLFVIPANANLAGAEIDLVNVPQRESRLSTILQTLDVDIVIIDCPPALGLLTINALTAADSVIIPVQAEYFALEGLGQLLNTIQLVRQSLNPRLEILGVVLTMFNKRTVLSEQVQAEIVQHFGEKVFSTVIPRNVRLAEAPSFGRTIFEHDKWSKGARAYKHLSEEVSKRIV